VAGYEAMGDAGGALGLTLAYVNVEEHDTVAKVGEQTTASFVQGGAYWRRSTGGWIMNAGGGAATAGSTATVASSPRTPTATAWPTWC
jgi:hypothetical protein